MIHWAVQSTMARVIDTGYSWLGRGAQDLGEAGERDIPIALPFTGRPVQICLDTLTRMGRSLQSVPAVFTTQASGKAASAVWETQVGELKVAFSIGFQACRPVRAGFGLVVDGLIPAGLFAQDSIAVEKEPGSSASFLEETEEVLAGRWPAAGAGDDTLILAVFQAGARPAGGIGLGLEVEPGGLRCQAWSLDPDSSEAGAGSFSWEIRRLNRRWRQVVPAGELAAWWRIPAREGVSFD